MNRDQKHTVDVRPLFDRRGDRINAHVLLCLLALILIRVAENESGESWHQLKRVFRPMLVADQHGVGSQTNKLTPEQNSVLDGLNLKTPKRYLQLPAPKRA